MSKRLSALLEDVLASAQLVRTYLAGLSKDDFLASTQVQDAVLRRIELIGEGVKNVPPAWRERLSEIPWRAVAGMRDVLIHRYFSVDLDVVWHTATHDIPLLEGQVAQLLDEARQDEARQQASAGSDDGLP